MLLWATENAVAGHIWPAVRYLPTPVIDKLLEHASVLQSILLPMPH